MHAAGPLSVDYPIRISSSGAVAGIERALALTSELARNRLGIGTKTAHLFLKKCIHYVQTGHQGSLWSATPQEQ